MELYQLTYFLSVARLRNFTRAALHLHLAQPALSQQIRKLEEELGAPLFVRGRRESRLTKAGEAFLPRVEALLAMAESARKSVSDISGSQRGRLVIATVQTLSAHWLPEIIGRFRRAHPLVELILRESSSEGVAELVANSTAEFGFLQLPANARRFDVTPLFTEPFVALLPRTHPLARARSIVLRQLAAEPFIFYKGKVRDAALHACRAANFEPSIACESSELGTIAALVRAGLGVAVLPRLAAVEPLKNLVAIPLGDPKLNRTLGMITTRGHLWSASASAFLQCGPLPAPNSRGS